MDDQNKMTEDMINADCMHKHQILYDGKECDPWVQTSLLIQYKQVNTTTWPLKDQHFHMTEQVNEVMWNKIYQT